MLSISGEWLSKFIYSTSSAAPPARERASRHSNTRAGFGEFCASEVFTTARQRNEGHLTWSEASAIRAMSIITLVICKHKVVMDGRPAKSATQSLNIMNERNLDETRKLGVREKSIEECRIDRIDGRR